MPVQQRSWTYAVTGLRPMMNALAKVEAPLETSTMEPLNKVAIQAFARTTNDVHVITGKLRASGRLTTKTFTHTWHMRIRYVAYRKNFNYAYYEKMRDGVKPGHGPHDYFANVEPIVDRGVERAMDKHFAPLKGK